MSAYVSGGLLPTGTVAPLHVRNEEDTTPGSPVGVLSFGTVVPTFIQRVHVSCSAAGRWQLIVDGTVVSAGRTAPGSPDSSVPFEVELPVGVGATVEVEFSARAGSPITQVFAQLVGRT